MGVVVYVTKTLAPITRVTILALKNKCNCLRDKFERGIKSLGKEEIKKIIDEDGKIDTECNFCHKKYHFSKEELENF